MIIIIYINIIDIVLVIIRILLKIFYHHKFDYQLIYILHCNRIENQQASRCKFANIRRYFLSTHLHHKASRFHLPNRYNRDSYYIHWKEKYMILRYIRIVSMDRNQQLWSCNFSHRYHLHILFYHCNINDLKNI